MKKMILLLSFVVALFTLYACTNEDDQITVQSVESLSPIEANINTSIETLSLPDSVEITLSDGSTLDVNVIWETGVLDQAGNTLLEGDLELPEEILNTQNLKATISVTVLPKTLLETLEALDDYQILYDAIIASELDRILGLEGPFTLFAPNDQAFNDFMNVLGITVDELLERDDLEELLLYHVLAGNYSENVLIATVPGNITTLEGSQIDVRLRSARVELNQSSLVEDSLQVKNGYLHKVNRVLISQTVVDSVIDDLFDDDLIAMFLDLLSEADIPLDLLLTGSVTVFLPNEEAFAELVERLDIEADDLLLLEGLADLLLYHVFAGRYLADQLYNDAPINIRNIRGDLLRVDVVDDTLMILDATVLSTETFGDFGLIHIIDRVLIPEELNEEWFNQND